ncbi:MAG: hypothetical protein WCV68_02295 [Candidatus Paceibacterota bacterium]
MEFLKDKIKFVYGNFSIGLVKSKKSRKSLVWGFTLVESVVATAIFVIIALGIYQAFYSLSGLVQISKLKSTAVSLANEKLEIARNLSYYDLGVIDGAPPGKIPQEKNEIRNGINFIVSTTVRSIDDPFDGTIASSTDLNPADYKLVSVEVACPSCRNYQPITLATRVSPKNLEMSLGHGALFVQVIDAEGKGIPDVDVKVTNTATTTIVIDKTNNAGLLQLVDLPPGELVYRVEVSKSGYSSSRTYAPGENGLARPANLNPTVSASQLTKMTLVIDKLSNLQVRTIDQYCQTPSRSFSFHLQGAKYLDSENSILKYNQDLTVSGLLSLTGLEWDTYKFTPNDETWAIVGSFPLQSVLLLPGATSEVKLLLAPPDGRGLLVSVKDGTSLGLPLSDVAVTLSKAGDTRSQSTSQGFFRDTDWSSGDSTGDGNITLNDPVGDLKLKEVLGSYEPEGFLISQLFDTGTSSTAFYSIVFQPTIQDPATGVDSVRFQIASSNDPATTTWDFTGPDGLATSFYTSSGQTIHSQHNDRRYVRYKVYLSTANRSYSPSLSDVAITYSSGCLPFGQVFFSGLSSGTYNVTAEKDGYQSYTGSISIDSNWQILEIPLNLQ